MNKPLRNILTFGDLCRYFEPAHNTPASLSRRVYKDTACGAWLSFVPINGRKYGEHEEVHPCVVLASFSIGSVVEGSKATFERKFEPLVPVEAVKDWLEELERLTSEAWEEANGSEEGEAWADGLTVEEE